jgi:hypothetical protein
VCGDEPAKEPAAKTAVPADPETQRQQAEFFEKKIRPLLAARCFECHGVQKQKGGLRVDSREALIQGGDTGASITPGDWRARRKPPD